MKKVNIFSPFKKGSSLFAIVFLLLCAATFTYGASELVQSQSSVGIEKVMHETNAKQSLTVTVALISIPALLSVRVSNSTFGLQWDRTEETLLEYLKNKSEPQAFEKFKTGQLRFRDYVLYRSLLIDGFSGIQKVWDRTVQKDAGITNVDRATLEKDQHVCIDRILIQMGNTGGAGTDPKAVVAYDGVVSGWPAGVMNGEISIYQDENPVLTDHPVNTCGSQADSPYAIGFADAYRLKTPFILEGDKPFEVRINFPAAVATANTDFLKIMFFGVGTRKRGMI